MKNPIKIAVILAIIGAMLLPGAGSGAEASTPWVIDGEKVYVDDENVYLSATPHTLTGSGWVEFELWSKHYEGEIDVIWGFDTSAGVSPRSPQVWADNVPHEEERWVGIEREGEANFVGLISYEPLEWGSVEPEIGNENNVHLGRLIGFSPDFGDYSVVIAFNSYINPTPTSATFYYNYISQEKEYYTEYYPDFRDFSVPDLTIVQRSYMGVDSWHFAKLGFTPNKDTVYRVRVWIDVPFTGLEELTSKYIWGVKPHGETIQEAISRGHLYLLDPWLATGWGQRVEITIDKDDVDSVLSDFPVLLYLSTSSGNNNADVSFIFDELTLDANRKKIAVTTADEETQCYVEIEKWVDADEEAWLWVEVPSVSDVADTILYLYYDADHADNDSYVGDPNSTPAEAVWDSNFKLVSHLRDDPDTSHTRDSTDQDNDLAKKGANEPIVSTSGQIADAQDFDGADDYLTHATFYDTMPSAFTIEKWVKWTGGATTARALLQKTNVAGEDRFWMDISGAGNTLSFNAEGNNQGPVFLSGGDLTINTWYHLVFVYDDAGNKLHCYVNTAHTEVAFNDTIGNGSAQDFDIGNYNTRGDAWDGFIDEIRVSSTARNVAWIKASYESGRDDLIAFGSEETGTPTVTAQAATNIEDTTATGNGNITDVGVGNCTRRGIVWDLASQALPGDVAPGASGYANDVGTNGDFGTGAFTESLTSLPTGDTIYYRAYALNAAGYDYSDTEINFLTKPAAPTNVAATDGTHPDKVVITWTKSTGATGYKVYEGVNLLDTLGDVATYDDTAAPAGTVTPGTASASDGTSPDHITLSLAGEGINDGASRTYKVVALNGTGDSDDSATNAGYRTPINLTHQWYRSAADADAGYGVLGGATTDPYNDTTAPANGDGRWYYCEVNATGATAQDSTHNRGWRAVAPTVTTEPCTGFDKYWAIVNGEVDAIGSFSVTAVGFDYGLSTSYGSSVNSTGSYSAGDEFWEKLTSLTPATVYHFRAKAYNGFWGYGGDRVFSTEGSPSLYEYLNTGGDGDSGAIFSANWTAQQFTSDNISHTITSIRVPLMRVGDYPGTVELAITHADSDNFSTGADLSSMIKLGNTMSDIAYVWYDFDIPDITLDASSKYTVVVRATGGNATDYILWQRVDAGALADAVGSHSMDSGISWITDAPADYLFEIWGEPVTDLDEAKVFSGYIEEGDWLITLLYKNTYAPYYPDQDPASYFYLQLVDGSTVKAQVACPAWGYRPGGIYLAKATADTLEWGAAYKVVLYGDFGINPVVEYVLTDADWRGSELTFLDNWVLLQAGIIGEADGVVLTQDAPDGQEVLNAAGTVIFTRGIVGLGDVRPNLFEISYHKPEMEDTDFPGAMQADTDWETKLGATIAGHLTDIGALVNADGKSVGGFFVLVTFIVFIVGGAILGNMVAGMIVGYIPLLGGAWCGVIDYVLLGVITFLAACIFVYQVFLKR